VAEWLDAAGYAAAWASIGDDDPYFHPAYLAASAPVGEGEVAAWSDGGLAYPFLVRPLAGGRCDLTSAYGFGGPLGECPGWRGRFREACARRGVVSEFIRFHPLRGNDAGLEDVETSLVQEMVTVDVRRDDDELRAGMRTQGRRNLARAAREGVAVRRTADLDLFHAAYIDAMRALGADPFYLFDRGYFTALERLGDALVLLDAGQATALYLCGGGAMHYHLGAVSADGRRTGAATAMHFEAMRVARERGLSTLHLGGGLTAGDSLWRFKATLGEGRAPYRVGRAVHDADAYAELCAAAGANAAAGGRFPAYRG
jgi:hypothetical protein